MKIKTLTLKNFKSIGEEAQTIGFKPITLLFGPNSVGKSTILQALAYLREVVVNDNPDAKVTSMAGQAMNLGGFDRLVHRRKGERKAPAERRIEIGIAIDIENDFLPDFLSPAEKIFIEKNVEEINDPGGMLSSIKELHFKFVIGHQSEYGGIKVVELIINDKEPYLLDPDKSNFAVLRPGVEGQFPAAIARFSPNFLPEDVWDMFRDMQKGNLIRTGFDLYVDGVIDSYYGYYFADGDGDSPELDQLLKEFKEHNKPNNVHILGNKKKSKSSKLEIHSNENIVENISNGIAAISEGAGELRNALYQWLDQSSKKDENGDYYNSAPLGFQFSEQASVIPPKGKLLEFNDGLWQDQLLIQVQNGDEQFTAQQLLWTSLISGLIVGGVDLLREALEKTNYIGPLRMIPERGFSPALCVNPSWANGEAAWVTLLQSVNHASPAYKDDLIKSVNHWLGDGRLATGYQVAVEHYTHVLSRDYLNSMLDDNALVPKLENTEEKIVIYEAKTGIQVEPNEIGVGISQLMPVLIAAITHKSGLFSIEQPELHLHPRMQCDLADLFISAMNDKTIWLLETHSEHFMLRLLRRIREEASIEDLDGFYRIQPEDVAVIYVEPNEGGVKIKAIHVDEEGEFTDRWPKGFFAERAKELFS